MRFRLATSRLANFCSYMAIFKTELEATERSEVAKASRLVALVLREIASNYNCFGAKSSTQMTRGRSKEGFPTACEFVFSQNLTVRYHVNGYANKSNFQSEYFPKNR